VVKSGPGLGGGVAASTENHFGIRNLLLFTYEFNREGELSFQVQILPDTHGFKQLGGDELLKSGGIGQDPHGDRLLKLVW